MRLNLKDKLGDKLGGKLGGKLANIKFKPQSGLTAREFLFVALLIVAIEGYLLFSYVLQPAYNRYLANLKELGQKETVLTGLKIDFSRKEEMENEILELEEQMTEFQKKMPPYVSQEEVIMFLEEKSIQNGLLVQGISFPGVAQKEQKIAAPKTQPAESATGETNIAPVAGGSTAVIADQQVVINFIGDYQQLYGFLKDVEDNERKVGVKNLSLQSSGSDNRLTGMLNLSFISYWDESDGQQPYEMTATPIPGKTSPFVEYSGYSATATQGTPLPQQTVKPDFYLMINSYLNNSSKVLLMNYFDSGSEAVHDRNEVVTAQLTLNESNGSYTFSYKLGSFDITSSRSIEIKDGKIRMDVVVQSKKSDQDRVGVMLDVTNNTSVPFEITVKGDDTSSPRFIRGKTAGSVMVK